MSAGSTDAGGPSGETREHAVGYPTGYNGSFWIALVIGWVVMVVGVRGLLVNAVSAMPTEPQSWLTLYVKLALLNDLVVLPVVFLVGWTTRRLVPARVRPVVQGGLICTAIVVVFAYPFVRRFGASPGNPTILPRNYTLGLVEVVGAIRLGAAVLCARRFRGLPATTTVEHAAEDGR